MFLTHKNMQFIPKNWGYELVIDNNEKYCGKILFIKKGQATSFHKHLIKEETLYCQSGLCHFRVENSTKIINPGDAVKLLPNTKHQMTALEDTTFFEVSTKHSDEDVVRFNS